MPFRILALTLLFFSAYAQDGADLYKHRCAPCHDTGMNRAPSPASLKQMSPEAVKSTLLPGSMAMIGMGLSTPQMRTVATFVTGKEFDADATPKRAYCSTSAPAIDKPLAGPHWNGWGVDTENH